MIWNIKYTFLKSQKPTVAHMYKMSNFKDTKYAIYGKR